MRYARYPLVLGEVSGTLTWEERSYNGKEITTATKAGGIHTRQSASSLPPKLHTQHDQLSGLVGSCRHELKVPTTGQQALPGLTTTTGVGCKAQKIHPYLAVPPCQHCKLITWHCSNTSQQGLTQ